MTGVPSRKKPASKREIKEDSRFQETRPFEFQINEVYRQEVVRLLSSRKKSKVIHSSGDIDASGDEIEVPFREFLKRRLPNQYFVGHGHIVDSSLNVSPQYDVIIADNNSTPILFEAENGCQYFPYESVYAIGEVKSTYVKAKHPIGTFAKNTESLKKLLKRTQTPPNYIGNGITLGERFQSNETRPYRNPLFQFILFFHSGDASRDALADEYCSSEDEHLPIISVFLDGKIVVKGELNEVPEGVSMGAIDLDPLRAIKRADLEWMYVDYKDSLNSGSQSLVAFMLGLFNHLNSCTLMDPPIKDYLNKVLQNAPHQPHGLSLGATLKMSKALGAELPPEFVDFVKYRQKKGLSIRSKFTDEQIQEYIKHLGEGAQLFQSAMELYIEKISHLIPSIRTSKSRRLIK